MDQSIALARSSKTRPTGDEQGRKPTRRSTLRLACVVGARPNFVKMAPLLRALDEHANVEAVLVHTGQHYDVNLSDVFFNELEMRRPDAFLAVGSCSHGQQTARVLEGCETYFREQAASDRPFGRVVVVGDVNSTMAAALAAVKLGIPVAHVEAGLRSFDRSMPEEINRVVTDTVADLLLVSEPSGMRNLRREGHPDHHLHLVGNVMIDTLLALLPKAQARDILDRYGLESGRYGVVTLHRPANVDSPEILRSLLKVLAEVSRRLPLVFPLHPRTEERIDRFGLTDVLSQAARILQLPAVGYIDFLALTSQASVIVTDSGGLQEESTALGIPCLTVRSNTERPITVEEGTSTLVGNEPNCVWDAVCAVLDGAYKRGRCPTLWDGQAAGRIARILVGSDA
ncbi:MAG: UDP-N-acetylglucosamine 2-epimerase (non-hydrolyzing) [Planctomycetes bacterium]|nr:UDP-N-acetylglucosamine 2-epimerase (non-hydrolyzing) [Planctomycetota bacterium]